MMSEPNVTINVHGNVTADDMNRWAAEQFVLALEAALKRRRREQEERERARRRAALFVAEPLTYVSPAHSEIEIAPASRWQRLRWWLRRVGR